MKIYNSLTRNKSLLQQKAVTIYSCGPTVYNYIHIGNARPAILMDVLVRFLKSKNITVDYLQNITDIDDKIIAKAIEENKTEKEISKFYTKAYLDDLKSLNIFMPNKLEPISKHIDKMIIFINDLIEQGYAYNVDGDVYFAINKWKPEYGELSGRKPEELISGERVEIDLKKKNPLDFSLWKKTNVGKTWNSPFGEGRPGWHTECALLIEDYFNGKTIDIHSGGIDLKFPHHENERIQYLAHNQKELSCIWMHNGHLNLNDQKMSKSIGNVFLVKDFIKEYNANILRWIFLSTNYKQPLNLTDDLIEQAKKFFDKLENLRKKVILSKTIFERIEKSNIKNYVKDFEQAMDNDLNTSLVLSIIEELIKHINQLVNQKVHFDCIFTLFGQLKHILETLGFTDLLNVEIKEADEIKLKKWNQLILDKKFEQADVLRAKLEKKGLM
ncbi:cysteinyl-tRNA synthetase [Williamsoniiplasma luminosum]|uniref:Cysteine--tRNA ligase n=1 Tax=Williamsoniiplasma luminosum TaxID=214888 RepID=A0A2K8NSP2_9MOLU|nr:cysteine--tRNA ligase [Williamsoniiplasma luminosum]ATZ16860.1 cysteinyl-tRNA synthetase [Williamsoniiplasma luminosum]